jgi:protein SCO1/2
MGPASEFTLTTQDDERLSLTDLHGKVVVVSFIFTRCADVCPLLTAKLVGIQKQLGSTFGSEVYFLSVSVDPEYDRPDVLKRYADALGCDPAGWSHLTGTSEEIRTMARNYGVFHEKQDGGEVDHNLLTSIIDRSGNLRVQYMGERFDPDEFLHDLRDLMDEDGS